MNRTSHVELLKLALLFEGGLIVVAGVIGWLFDVNPLDELEWSWSGLQLGLAATVPLFALFLVTYWLPFGPLQRIRRFLQQELGPWLAGCRWFEAVLIALTAGVGEEILFRGVLQPLCGIWGASLLFGLAHAITPTYAIVAGLIGGYLGWLVEWSDNLLPAIVVHSVYDFLAILVVGWSFRRQESRPGISP
jgi:membrane protease YdiL (CAAX protease family)